jgi:hypothetical protein
MNLSRGSVAIPSLTITKKIIMATRTGLEPVFPP